MTVRVLVQRAPEGSDGVLTPPTPDNTFQNAGLLKLDDEVKVQLSAADSAFEIEPSDPHAASPIRRLLPGAWAEWTWQVKALRPGEYHLEVTADVVYRHNFQNYDPPIVTFTSFTKSLSIQVAP